MSDELIEAVAKAIDEASKNARLGQDWQWFIPEARAAISVIAPAVLDEAALVCDAEAVDCRNEWIINLGDEDVKADVADDCAEAIRALKTRYV